MYSSRPPRSGSKSSTSSSSVYFSNCLQKTGDESFLMFRVMRLCSMKGDTRISLFCLFFYCTYCLIKEKKHAQVTIYIENVFETYPWQVTGFPGINQNLCYRESFGGS